MSNFNHGDRLESSISVTRAVLEPSWVQPMMESDELRRMGIEVFDKSADFNVSILRAAELRKAANAGHRGELIEIGRQLEDDPIINSGSVDRPLVAEIDIPPRFQLGAHLVRIRLESDTALFRQRERVCQIVEDLTGAILRRPEDFLLDVAIAKLRDPDKFSYTLARDTITPMVSTVVPIKPATVNYH